MPKATRKRATKKPAESREDRLIRQAVLKHGAKAPNPPRQSRNKVKTYHAFVKTGKVLEPRKSTAHDPVMLKLLPLSKFHRDILEAEIEGMTPNEAVEHAQSKCKHRNFSIAAKKYRLIEQWHWCICDDCGHTIGLKKVVFGNA